MTFARENIAHDKRPGSVIALDEQLGFAQHPSIDASGAPPRRFCPVQSVPLDDVAYAPTLLFVKPLFCRRKMPRGLRAFLVVAAPEDNGVHLEKELQMPHRKQVEALGDQGVYELVASHQVRDEAVLESVPSGFEEFVDFREMSLQFPKRGLDRRQIEYLTQLLFTP